MIIRILIAFLILSILGMGIAFLDMPEWYYEYLRVLLCSTSLATGIYDLKRANIFWVAIFLFLAVVFNPIMPFHLHSKTNWLILDVVAACIFTLKIYIYWGSSSFRNYLQ